MTGLLFAVAAVIVWASGVRLSSYVDVLADRFGIGEALAGALLLGGATSLPEVATTVTAAGSGAAQLAGGNLLGGVIAQLGVLAVVDAVFMRGRALTFFAPSPAVLMQGVFLVLMAGLAAAAISSGELVTVGGVGLWPVLLAGTYVLGLAAVRSTESRPRWHPIDQPDLTDDGDAELRSAESERYADVPTHQVSMRFGVSALGVLTGGFVLARTGESLAETTGLGQTFVGATAVAVATSLPEITTTAAAVRIGAYSMAMANILGTNALEIALFLPADLAYRDGSIIDAMDPSAAFLAAVGVVATAVYLWGILERRDRTIGGMGVDSFVVTIVVVAGWAVFFTI